MSEIKVNKISPRTNCGTVTLGDSGDTFSIPAGVTLTNSGTATGFGPTGAVSWDTTPKTTTVTAASGVGYFINTTSSGVTVNLPAGVAGAIVALADYAATWNTNNVTVNANGSEKIGGVASAPATLNTQGQAVTFIYVDSTQGWTNVGDATKIAGNAFVTATGGTVLTCGDFKTHVFTGPGSFVVSNAGAPSGSNSIEYLVVAGGGGGAKADVGGGGGAGGFRQNYPSPTTTGLPVTATTYPITVGGGGSAGSPSGGLGTSGSNSIFSTITSTGGGGGGASPTITSVNGLPGGSGGGGGHGGPAPVGGSGNTPPTSPSQGNPGGNGSPGPGGAPPQYGAGGGGGAGAAGTNGTNPAAGPGGVGSPIATAFFGPTAPSYGTPGPAPGRYFAGGAGGARDDPGTGGSGGSGGGGTGGSGSISGTAGTTNTGGGGGGSGEQAPVSAGAGGSGIVVIRYKFQ